MARSCRSRRSPSILLILFVLSNQAAATMEHEQLTARIIGCAMLVQRTLGAGFLESVYQNALAHELRGIGLLVEREKRVQVRYRNMVVGDFCADVLIDSRVLIETKAVRSLTPAHEVQLVNYLTATGIEVGLLLNFGSERLEVRRKTRTYRAKTIRQDEQDEHDDGLGRSSATIP